MKSECKLHEKRGENTLQGDGNGSFESSHLCNEFRRPLLLEAARCKKVSCCKQHSSPKICSNYVVLNQQQQQLVAFSLQGTAKLNSNKVQLMRFLFNYILWATWKLNA